MKKDSKGKLLQNTAKMFESKLYKRMILLLHANVFIVSNSHHKVTQFLLKMEKTMMYMILHLMLCQAPSSSAQKPAESHTGLMHLTSFNGLLLPKFASPLNSGDSKRLQLPLAEIPLFTSNLAPTSFIQWLHWKRREYLFPMMPLQYFLFPPMP